MKFGLRARMVSGLLSRDLIAGHSPVAVSKMEPSMVGRKGLAGGTADGRLSPPVTRGGSNYDIGANASGMVTVGPDPIVGNLLNRVDNEIYAARVKDWVNNNSVSVISHTVTNFTDPHVYFAWAAY